MVTIEELRNLKETEDNVEFKEAKNSFNFDGGTRTDQKERRKCYLGYVVAFANEGGGKLIFGMADSYPHTVVGSNFSQGKLGALEDKVYKRLGIRIHCTELFDETGLRVLVTDIPSRPTGKMMKFEGVPLMRTGDSLRNMSDEEMFSILSESEPDFSAKVCNGLTLDDLDNKAFDQMLLHYQMKNQTSQINSLSKEQILSDFDLLVDNKLNYAALILLGKEEKIAQYLPQCKIIWEFRNTTDQIYYDRREEVQLPLFMAVNKIWSIINQPTLNKKRPIQLQGYIFDIFDFNEEVIREALLNAIAHRDYTINSEIVIKQYPDKIIFINPGGFPKGVTLENLLRVNSTPRSRLMTEIMQKTGLVERSGQGVDKIFSITLSEGKAEPTYQQSDNFQVTLILYAKIEDTAFHIFLQNYKTRNREPLLGVEQIITLYRINKNMQTNLDQKIIEELEKANLIEKTSANSHKYILSLQYQSLYEETLRIGTRYLIEEVKGLVLELQDKRLKIGDLEVQLSNLLSRNQIKYLLSKLIEDDILRKEGIGKGTYYLIHEQYDKLRGSSLVNRIARDLKEKYE